MAPTPPPYWTFARFALASLLPFALFGVVLVMQHRVQGERRALAEAATRAALVEAAVIQPAVPTGGLEASIVERTLSRVGRSASVLHLRIWDASGQLVAASGAPGVRPLDADALAGSLAGEETSVRGSIDGVDALAVYRPLVVGGTTVGVLELAVPWAPFGSGVQNDALWVAIVVAGGLVVIWLALAGLAVLSERRLRREAARVRDLSDRDPLTGLPNRPSSGSPSSRRSPPPTARATGSRWRSSTSTTSRR